MSNSKNKIICLAGMGRSGTSLMASYLQHCGIPMGDDVLAPGKWNRKGFYEDKEFLSLHKHLLDVNKSNLYVPKHVRVVPAEDRARARDVLDKRNNVQPVWGWKDPRTSLFMDLWLELDRDIKFIFMYRNPYEVIQSLYRTMKKPYLYFQPWLGPKGWLYYNTLLLNYQERYPDRCQFVSIHGFDNEPEQSAALLSDWLGFSLDKPYSDVYEPSDRRSGSMPFPINVWMPMAHKLYGKQISEVYSKVEDVALIKSSFQV